MTAAQEEVQKLRIYAELRIRRCGRSRLLPFLWKVRVKSPSFCDMRLRSGNWRKLPGAWFGVILDDWVNLKGLGVFFFFCHLGYHRFQAVVVVFHSSLMLIITVLGRHLFFEDLSTWIIKSSPFNML